MGVEIEKKYRLTNEQRDSLTVRLRELGARLNSEDFETNTLYAGNNLDTSRAVLRLRRVEGKSVLTYKEKGVAEKSDVSSRREDETEVADADALHAILEALGFKPSLIYEKRRATWMVDDAEVTIDELPFGWYVEIEAESETNVREIEKQLDLHHATAEAKTYPELTTELGTKHEGLIEARFNQT